MINHTHDAKPQLHALIAINRDLISFFAAVTHSLLLLVLFLLLILTPSLLVLLNAPSLQHK